MGTKLGGKSGHKPGGKKPFKPYNSTEKKNRPGKAADGVKKQNKLNFSQTNKGSQKRKMPHFKGKKREEDGEGEGGPFGSQYSFTCITYFAAELLDRFSQSAVFVYRSFLGAQLAWS